MNCSPVNSVNFYDDERLAAEVAIFADRCAIDEELKRLVSHFAQGRKILAKGRSAREADGFPCTGDQPRD